MCLIPEMLLVRLTSSDIYHEYIRQSQLARVRLKARANFISSPKHYHNQRKIQNKGIEINGSILKITQLVDDTTCFVADIPSVKETLVMFKCIQLCASLKINTDKTKANYAGSLKGRVEAPLGLD